MLIFNVGWYKAFAIVRLFNVFHDLGIESRSMPIIYIENGSHMQPSLPLGLHSDRNHVQHLGFYKLCSIP